MKRAKLRTYIRQVHGTMQPHIADEIINYGLSVGILVALRHNIGLVWSEDHSLWHNHDLEDMVEGLLGEYFQEHSGRINPVNIPINWECMELPTCQTLVYA